MPNSTTDWQARADELHERGSVPKRRAAVVALREAGFSHTEVADELELTDRSKSAHYQRLYREQREKATWLTDHGAEL